MGYEYAIEGHYSASGEPIVTSVSIVRHSATQPPKLPLNREEAERFFAHMREQNKAVMR